MSIFPENFYYDRTDAVTFVCMLMLVSSFFFLGRRLWGAGDRKRQAWTINLLCSFTLSICGVIDFLYVEKNGLWTYDFIYSDERYARTIVLFFTAVNVLDLSLGWIFYREHLHPLTTIVHHSYFIIVLTTMLGAHHITGLVLTFIMEIPTFILTVGTIWPQYRSDLWFGVTFFTFRIGFHLYMIYRLAQIHAGFILLSFICTFPLHAFWGYRLILGYQKKFSGAKNSSKDE
jgi:hypothetical protein